MNGATSAIKTKIEAVSQETSTPVQICDPAVWVHKYGNCLFRYALSYVRHVQTAEDLVQETFLAALSSQNRFCGGSSERTWLVGILKHKVIDHYRALKKQNAIAELADIAGEEPPGNAGRHEEEANLDLPVEEWHIHPGICTQQKAFWDVLQQCLSKVSPRMASAFALKEIEQLDTKEICESLNVSEGNLWVMLHRARTYLRQCLETNWFKKAA